MVINRAPNNAKINEMHRFNLYEDLSNPMWFVGSPHIKYYTNCILQIQIVTYVFDTIFEFRGSRQPEKGVVYVPFS